MRDDNYPTPASDPEAEGLPGGGAGAEELAVHETETPGYR